MDKTLDGDEALNVPDATEATVEAPTTEIEAPQVEEQGGEVTTETPETKTEEGSDSIESKKSANARVREALAEAKAAKEEARSLAEQIAELTGTEQYNPTQYQPNPQPGSEVTTEQYQADVARQASYIVDLKLAQSKNFDRINRESTDSIKTNPELDPTSDEFDPELSEAVTRATLAHIRVNPTDSVTKFVDSLMKPYRKALNKKIGQETETVAKQVSESALRPTTVKQEGKSATEKSIKELEEELGVFQT